MPKVEDKKKVIKKTEAKTKKAGETEKTEQKKSVKADSELFAVIETGGKQHKVSVGNKIKIEKIKGEIKEGDSVIFDKVLLVDNGKDTTSIGDPYLKGAAVKGKVEKIARAKKISVIRYKAKSRYFKKKGHRQPYFEVLIEAIK